MSDDQVLGAVGGQTRRALLVGAGAVGASVVLAACGDDSEDVDLQGDGPSPSAPGGAPGGLARTTDIPVGGGVILAAQGVVITQPTAGEFKGFDPICTHQNCPVSKVDGGTINCSCHGSKFSISDGSVKTGPATKPLPAKELKIDGDQISLA
jgi:Rieske Fe-S protein